MLPGDIFDAAASRSNLQVGSSLGVKVAFQKASINGPSVAGFH